MFDEPSSLDVQSFQDTSESPDTLLGRFRRELARGPAVIEDFCSIGHQTTVPFRIGDQHRVPRALRLIVAKCLAPIAALRMKRYSTSQELELELAAFLNGRVPPDAVSGRPFTAFVLRLPPTQPATPKVNIWSANPWP